MPKGQTFYVYTLTDSQRLARQIMGAARVLAGKYKALPINLMVAADGH